MILYRVFIINKRGERWATPYEYTERGPARLKAAELNFQFIRTGRPQRAYIKRKRVK